MGRHSRPKSRHASVGMATAVREGLWWVTGLVLAVLLLGALAATALNVDWSDWSGGQVVENDQDAPVPSD